MKTPQPDHDALLGALLCHLTENIVISTTVKPYRQSMFLSSRVIFHPAIGEFHLSLCRCCPHTICILCFRESGVACSRLSRRTEERICQVGLVEGQPQNLTGSESCSHRL